MQTVTLVRIQSDDQGTLGRVVLYGKPRFYSLELPWLENKSGASCIPIGNYVVKWTRSPRLKRHTYEIKEVKGRTGIRIHSGNLAGRKPNFTTHSLGCPLLGLREGFIKGQRAVLCSAIAVRRFERLLNNQDFKLEIRNA